MINHINENRTIILEFPKIHPFVIGIWCGISKPPVNEYLQQFVTELKFLMDNNLIVEGNEIKINFGLIISDTPARAMIKGYISFINITSI